MIALKLKLIIVFFSNLILNKDHDIKVLYDPIISKQMDICFRSNTINVLYKTYFTGLICHF